MILSDLLHFDSFHDILLASVTSLLAQTRTSHLHVAVSLFIPFCTHSLPSTRSQAGNYTPPHVCDTFLSKAKQQGLTFKEVIPKRDEQMWLGQLEIPNFDHEALSLRKAACRYWIGRWV